MPYVINNKVNIMEIHKISFTIKLLKYQSTTREAKEAKPLWTLTSVTYFHNYTYIFFYCYLAKLIVMLEVNTYNLKIPRSNLRFSYTTF